MIANQGLDDECCRREIVDPREVADVQSKTRLLLDWLSQKGLKPEEIVLDPTGGMTPMSLGAFSVAQERMIDTQYVRSKYDDQNRPIHGTQEVIFLSRYSLPAVE